VKAGLERWLLARWYGGREPGWFLCVLSWLYRGLLALHAFWMGRLARKAGKLPVPVIVIGNFTAGGTGKTPLVIALATHFVTCGRRPGVVSRGHGRVGIAPVRVNAETPADDCGDEPLLIHRLAGVPVQVDTDRMRAAKALVEAGCDLILADDGLQHRRLARDIEIEVRDGVRGLGNGRLLPAGPLREPPRQVDFLVVNGGKAADTPGAWPMTLPLGEAQSLDGRQTRPLSGFVGGRLHAVAGIGHPARFFDALRAAGLDAIEHPFPDHHAYARGDFRGMEGTILMTAKDAVKCAGLGLRDAWQVPVEACLPPEFHAALDARLAVLAHSGSP
jgi:tetraacyldisaccharide 4'-kinase